MRTPFARVLSLLLMGAILAQPVQLLVSKMRHSRSTAQAIKKPLGRSVFRVRTTLPISTRGRDLDLACADAGPGDVLPVATSRPSPAASHPLGSVHTASSPPLRC